MTKHTLSAFIPHLDTVTRMLVQANIIMTLCILDVHINNRRDSRIDHTTYDVNET
jgi:hypothetical protein